MLAADLLPPRLRRRRPATLFHAALDQPVAAAAFTIVRHRLGQIAAAVAIVVAAEHLTARIVDVAPLLHVVRDGRAAELAVARVPLGIGGIALGVRLLLLRLLIARREQQDDQERANPAYP